MIAASRNPFYPLLLVISTAFAITAFAYAGLPWDRQPEWLQAHGWQLLLAEVAAVILCGLASMGLDSHRNSKSEIRNQNQNPNVEFQKQVQP